MIVGTVRKSLAWLGGHGNLFIAAVLIVVGATWGFIELAERVLEGDTQQFDEWAVRALRQPDDPATPARESADPLGPRWLHEVGRDMTARWAASRCSAS